MSETEMYNREVYEFEKSLQDSLNCLQTFIKKFPNQRKGKISFGANGTVKILWKVRGKDSSINMYFVRENFVSVYIPPVVKESPLAGNWYMDENPVDSWIWCEEIKHILGIEEEK